jgi:tRNA pseudouridine55 synthase
LFYKNNVVKFKKISFSKQKNTNLMHCKKLFAVSYFIPKKRITVMEEQKPRRKPFMEDGILLVDKPKEWTSHDVVNYVRSAFKIKKVGHCGTLDPAATGLLVVVVGKATKVSQQLSGQDKVYETTMLLGTETDSLDMDGKVTAQNDSWKDLTTAKIKTAIKDFIGEQMQTPPMVSAKKKNGKKLYELAREGKVIERDPVPINISSITIEKIEAPIANFTVSCSKGTYIRVLCSDIGTNLGCGAVLKDLRRTQSGMFDIKDACTIEELKSWDQEMLAEKLLWLHNMNL